MNARGNDAGRWLHGLLVAAGLAFTLTACAYAVMAFRATRAGLPSAGPGGALLLFLDRHGLTLLGGELLALAAATVAVIVHDAWRDRRDTPATPPTDAANVSAGLPPSDVSGPVDDKRPQPG